MKLLLKLVCIFTFATITHLFVATNAKECVETPFYSHYKYVEWATDVVCFIIIIKTWKVADADDIRWITPTILWSLSRIGWRYGCG